MFSLNAGKRRASGPGYMDEHLLLMEVHIPVSLFLTKKKGHGSCEPWPLGCLKIVINLPQSPPLLPQFAFA